MYIYLCCYAIWDVGGVWSWLVVAQRKSITAIARYDAAGQVSHVLTITRQGFYHTYMSLVAGSASQMQMQAPVNTTPELDLPNSKRVLKLAQAIMGANFNANDSLCKSSRFALWKLCCMPACAVATWVTSLEHVLHPRMSEESQNCCKVQKHCRCQVLTRI